MIAYRTAAEAVRARADDSSVGLRFEGRQWSWAEVVEEMSVRAERARERTRPGPPHVGVLLDNVPEHLFQLGAAALAGSVVVGLNSTRRGEELARDVRHTDCRVVVTDAEHRALLDGLDLGGATVIEAGVGDEASPTRGPRPAASTPDPSPTRAPRPAASTPGSSPHPPPDPSPDDLLLLLFTSGSTGAPKAVRVTQGRAAQAAAGLGLGPDDVVYCAMPLFHGNALISSVFPAIGTGATIVLRRRFSASEFSADIRAAGCTFAATVGRALAYVVSTPGSEEDRDNRLRYVLAPESSVADIAAFRRRFGCPVITGYGSSENAVILVPAPGLPPDALGVPPEGLDVAVVDAETGAECPRARFDGAGSVLNASQAIGEIVGRNALGRFEGYYKNPEATAARTRQGWYWTGDLGYRDEEGVFFFAGRTTDWLRVDGENFAGAPVERALSRFPGVTGVAVVGVPDERTADDQVMAVLEMPEPSRFDPAAFDRFLDGQDDLGTKWSPRYVRVLDALPVTATNKVDKSALRTARWQVDDGVYWRPERRQPLRRMSPEDQDRLRRSLRLHRHAGPEGSPGAGGSPASGDLPGDGQVSSSLGTSK